MSQPSQPPYEQPPQPPQPPQGDWPPPAPPPGSPHSTLSILSFIVALVGFIGGIIPFGGFLGTIGLILGLVDKNTPDPPDTPKRHGLSTAGVVLGALSTLGAFVWGGLIVWGLSTLKSGSCPHLYAFDGESYQLDADLASGALYKGAERDDLDRLEALRPVDGEYRVRLQNDLDEIDNIDSLSLLVVDAPSDAEVLPTPSQGLVAVRGAVAPRRAVDAWGTSVLPQLAAADGQSVGVARSTPPAGVAAPATEGDPRDSWTLEFDRPAGDRATLVVRGRNTAFAEQAFIRYMASMGQGVRPLLELSAESYEGCACYQEYMAAEIDRMGFPLAVSVSVAGGPAVREALSPVGPATLRSQAFSFALPPGEGPVVVRLEATPRFWELDRIALAPAADLALSPRTLAPRSASSAAGDQLGLLTGNDGRRAVLRPGERVDLRFEAPPPPAPGLSRTVVARLRGYYDLDIGGHRGVNVAQIAAHRLGWTSLPRFAEKLDLRLADRAGAGGPRDPGSPPGPRCSKCCAAT